MSMFDGEKIRLPKDMHSNMGREVCLLPFVVILFSVCRLS